MTLYLQGMSNIMNLLNLGELCVCVGGGGGGGGEGGGVRVGLA